MVPVRCISNLMGGGNQTQSLERKIRTFEGLNAISKSNSRKHNHQNSITGDQKKDFTGKSGKEKAMIQEITLGQLKKSYSKKQFQVLNRETSLKSFNKKSSLIAVNIQFCDKLKTNSGTLKDKVSDNQKASI